MPAAEPLARGYKKPPLARRYQTTSKTLAAGFKPRVSYLSGSNPTDMTALYEVRYGFKKSCPSCNPVKKTRYGSRYAFVSFGAFVGFCVSKKILPLPKKDGLVYGWHFVPFVGIVSKAKFLKNSTEAAK